MQNFLQSLVLFAMKKHKTLQNFLQGMVFSAFFFGKKKHRTLQDLLALPLPKGVMLANFSRPTGAVYRRVYGIAPIKGGNAVRFVVPPPREVQRIFFSPHGLCVWPRGCFDFKTFWDLSSKSSEIKAASRQL